jgi:membrane protein insertase Oxa1/YidC/SpoIIIJ
LSVRLTTIGIALAAFTVADIVHEGLGHGGACLALGGKMLLLSSTYEDCSLRSPLIDGAGPMAGIVAAILFYLVLRLSPPKNNATRAFLVLGFAFTAFWNFGYMIKSGFTNTGDWAFVIAGLHPAVVWRTVLTILGIVFYAITMRLLTASLRRDLAAAETAPSDQTPFAFTALAFATAVIAASAAGLLDPRGWHTVWTDAAPSALAAIGLVRVGYRVNQRDRALRVAIAASPAWIAIGGAAAAVLIAVLGPGLRF